MPIFARLSSWRKARQPKPLDQLLSIELDGEEVRVVAHCQMDATWDEAFCWKDMGRVCFTDEGLYPSDRISVELKGEHAGHRAYRGLGGMSSLERSPSEGISQMRYVAKRWGRPVARRIAGHQGRIVDNHSL